MSNERTPVQESALGRDEDSKGLSRRGFLGGLSGAAAAVGLAGAASVVAPNTVEAVEIGPESAGSRRANAEKVRKDAAKDQKQRPLPAHPCNGDETLYGDLRAQFAKTLPHNGLGEPVAAAYLAFVGALDDGDDAALAAVPRGGTAKLVNPRSAYAFEMVGPDSHHLGLPPAPAFASAWEASEMAEVYWQAITRDVPFASYGSDATIAAAAADLSSFSDFRGPKSGSLVTPATLFRGGTANGDLVGPYISQFLFKPIPYGPMVLEQKYRVPVAGQDKLTSYTTWLANQRGISNDTALVFDATPRFLRSGRDLCRWVQADFTYQGFLNAALILLSFGSGALSPSNPYLSVANQAGFATLGGPDVLHLVSMAGDAALKAAWYQKWLVHRRLRPEAFAGRVHNQVTGAKNYGIHGDLLGSPVLGEVFTRFGSYLLPMAYSEGCPAHPAYPAGHATISGACTTILKAFFNPAFSIPSPVEASADGLSLLPHAGSLTVLGELDKLAANISIGRDTAGVHWRTDGIEGMNLGEQVALGILRDYVNTYTEADFTGWTITKFDGTTESIVPS